MYPQYANAIPHSFSLDTSDDFENSNVSNLEKTPNKKRTRTYEQQILKNQKSYAKRKEKTVKGRLEQTEQVQATQTSQEEEEENEEDPIPHKRNIISREVYLTIISISKRKRI